jgi:hypothetical protein
MKQLILTSLISFITISTTLGQRGSLKGVVVDKSTTGNISFATVALMEAGEQNAFTGTVSNENGEFLLEKVPYGTYEMVVSFIGYNSMNIPDITISSGSREINLGNIELEQDAIGIEEVEVRAAAKTSVNKIDRRTYRADEFETARGGTAIDVLGKLPSITISSENEIMVRGSSDFVVYLNGKPTNIEAYNLLGQIPSENIENIDIITVPGSGFDAQGKGGIINISTKRETSTGLTVLATGMLGGTPWTNGTDVFSNHELNNNRFNGGLNLNYSHRDLSIHGAISYSKKNNKGIGDIYTYIYQDENQANPDTWYILDGMGARPKWDENLYTNFGLDYSLGESSDISANYQYSRRHNGRAAHYKYDTYFASSTDGSLIPGTLYELYNPNDIHRRGTFQNFSLDYRFNYQESSSFRASFLYERSNLEQTIDNKEYAYIGDVLYYDYYSDDSGNPVFHSFQMDETPLDAYRASIHYNKDFENGNSLKAGASSQFVRLEGFYEYDTLNTATGEFAGYDYFNNSIDLDRDVYAVYTEYSGTYNNISYILGLRMEYMDQVMDVSSTLYFEEVYEVFDETGRDFDETRFEQNKLDLFPSLHISYTASEQNTFTLAAGHRINRPPAKNMAPFLYRRHQEIFEMGDPLLEPEYSWNADLTYEREMGKHDMTLGGFIRTTTNAIYRVNRLDYDLANKGGVLLRSYTNAGNQLAAGGEMGFNFFFLDRIKLFLGGSIYQFNVESNESLFGDQSTSSSLNWDAKSNLSLQIFNPLRLTADYSIKSQTVTPQGEDLQYQMLNIALTYTPEKLEGWSIFAKMLDVAGTNQSGGYTAATEGSTDVFRRDWVYDYEGQIIEIGASFTFNQRKEKEKQKLIGDEYF